MNLVGIEKVGNNPYQYNQQSEKQTDPTGKGYFYETPLRHYDPQLGRFHAVDLLAQEYASLTPYQYGGNSSILFSDPTGAMPRAISDGYDLWLKAGEWEPSANCWQNYLQNNTGRPHTSWAIGLAGCQAGMYDGYGVGSSNYTGPYGNPDYTGGMGPLTPATVQTLMSIYNRVPSGTTLSNQGSGIKYSVHS